MKPIYAFSLFALISMNACFHLTQPAPLTPPPPAAVVPGAELAVAISYQDKWVTSTKESKTCVQGTSDCLVTTYEAPERITERNAAFIYGNRPVKEDAANALLFELERESSVASFTELRAACGTSIKRTKGYRYATLGLGALAVVGFAVGYKSTPEFVWVGYGGLAGGSITAALGHRAAGTSCQEAHALRARIEQRVPEAANDEELKALVGMFNNQYGRSTITAPAARTRIPGRPTAAPAMKRRRATK